MRVDLGTPTPKKKPCIYPPPPPPPFFFEKSYKGGGGGVYYLNSPDYLNFQYKAPPPPVTWLLWSKNGGSALRVGFFCVCGGGGGGTTSLIFSVGGKNGSLITGVDLATTRPDPEPKKKTRGGGGVFQFRCESRIFENYSRRIFLSKKGEVLYIENWGISIFFWTVWKIFIYSSIIISEQISIEWAICLKISKWIY